jgi:hypothetical protein
MCRLADALAPARLHTLLNDGTEERIRQVDNSIGATSPIIQGCPFCEVYEHPNHGAVCLSCRGFLSEGLLKALRRIPALPEILPTSSGTPARAAGIGSRDVTLSFSGSQAGVPARDADNRLYGVA